MSGTPFTLECQGCDDGSNITSIEQATFLGWLRISENTWQPGAFIGTCPDCQREQPDMFLAKAERKECGL